MSEPTQPPEAELIERLRTSVRPKLSVRGAAKASDISDSRWRQIIKGYRQETKDLRVPVRAPADTLARMADVVGATPDQLREVGREDAAGELEALLAVREATKLGLPTGRGVRPGTGRTVDYVPPVDIGPLIAGLAVDADQLRAVSQRLTVAIDAEQFDLYDIEELQREAENVAQSIYSIAKKIVGPSRLSRLTQQTREFRRKVDTDRMYDYFKHEGEFQEPHDDSQYPANARPDDVQQVMDHRAWERNLAVPQAHGEQAEEAVEPTLDFTGTNAQDSNSSPEGDKDKKTQASILDDFGEYGLAARRVYDEDKPK